MCLTLGIMKFFSSGQLKYFIACDVYPSYGVGDIYM